MAWLVGVDEAGYGPNLGPFVMTAQACRVPEEHADANLWQLLRKVVRRPDWSADERLLIADSKAVYTPARGLGELERGVLACLGIELESASLQHLLKAVQAHENNGLPSERWYRGLLALPYASEAEPIRDGAKRWQTHCEKHAISWMQPCVVIVCAEEFNRVTERFDSKGAVLGEALRSLLDRLFATLDGDESVTIHIDKHGGRNNYAGMLQEAFPDGFVVAGEEGMNRSAYRVLGLGREVQLVFEPKADDRYFNVALASMVSKYVRELLMEEFNAFWCEKVPELAPTAGYPNDAVRFYRAIEPLLSELGMAPHQVWRAR